jgi:RND superfamily putative drug exporter
MNLLSVAAAYGIVALVLQGGWAGRLVGIDAETPLPAFVPVLMFAVLFGAVDGLRGLPREPHA